MRKARSRPNFPRDGRPGCSNARNTFFSSWHQGSRGHVCPPARKTFRLGCVEVEQADTVEAVAAVDVHGVPIDYPGHAAGTVEFPFGDPSRCPRSNEAELRADVDRLEMAPLFEPSQDTIELAKLS